MAITALNHRGMLRTRTSILSGVTAPQACNRASRNLAIEVGGLSISLINSPIWSQICSMGLDQGSEQATVDLSPPPLENSVYFVQHGAWHCHVQAQHFFGKLTQPREGDFSANASLLVDHAIHQHHLRFA